MRSISVIIARCAIGIAFAWPGSASCTSFAGDETPSAGSYVQEGTQDSPAADLSGNWQVSFAGKQGSRQATMQIKQDSSKVSGSFEGERGSAPVSGTLNGSDISFTVKAPRREISFTGTVHGNKMSGTTEQGGSWSATRQ